MEVESTVVWLTRTSGHEAELVGTFLPTSLTLRLLRRRVNWLSWPRGRSLASARYLRHLLLTSKRLQKVMRYGSFLAAIGRLPKLRARARLDELDCFAVVVVVDWDDKINNAIVAVDTVKTNSGLDSWFGKIDDTVVAVETVPGLDCFGGVTGSSPTCKN